jgi:hypothetical protein
VQWVAKILGQASPGGVYVDSTGVYVIFNRNSQINSVTLYSGVLGSTTPTSKTFPIPVSNSATIVVKYTTDGTPLWASYLTNASPRYLVGDNNAVYIGCITSASLSNCEVYTGSNANIPIMGTSPNLATNAIITKLFPSGNATNMTVNLEANDASLSPVAKTISYSSSNSAPIQIVPTGGNVIKNAFTNGNVTTLSSYRNNASVDLLYENNTWYIKNMYGFNASA